jgi:hypothetical protein
MEAYIDYIKVFSESEMYTGNISGMNVLFRCAIYEDSLYFLLYDFVNIYSCQQSSEEIIQMNKKLNTSLEISDGNVNSLSLFILDNIIRAEDNLNIMKEEQTIKFEIILNILKVRWEFVTEQLDDVILKDKLESNNSSTIC